MNWNLIFGRFSVFVEWFSYFIYLNLLWILFAVLGVVVLGIFPATLAMFSVTRKWVLGETDAPIFWTFWAAYRSGFWKGNLMGGSFLVLGIILTEDMRFLHHHLSSLISVVLFGFVAIVTLCYVMTMLYIFPSMVHYNTRFFAFVRLAFVVSMRQPLLTLLLLLVLFLGVSTVRGVVPIFSGSLICYAITWVAIRGFRKLDRKESSGDTVSEGRV